MSTINAQVYFDVMRFYAGQMRLLDELDIRGYVETFTEDGVTDHVHRGERLEGRAAMMAGAQAALPRYSDTAVRHWNDHYLIDEIGTDTFSVTYCSLVSRTDTEGRVTFEPTFSIQDVLVRAGDRLLVRSRAIHRDRPSDRVAQASSALPGPSESLEE